jgi:hypothetical protein
MVANFGRGGQSVAGDVMGAGKLAKSQSTQNRRNGPSHKNLSSGRVPRPLVVEDGSGLATANAYVSQAYVDTHHADRNNTRWTDFTTPEKEASIIRATDYIDKRFGRQFLGIRRQKEQGLEWPRLDAFDNDGFLLTDVDEVPRQLEKACAEYALRAAICGVLAPDPLPPVPKQSMETGAGERDTNVITGEVVRSRDKIGPLEEERWFESRSQTIGKNLAAGATSVKSSLVNDFVIPEYPEADLWLEELLRSSMTIMLSRGD